MNGKKISELNAEHEAWLDQQPTTVSCAWCRWTAQGTAAETREKFAAHRLEKHPERTARSRAQIAKEQKRERENAAREQREEVALARSRERVKKLEVRMERMSERAPKRFRQWTQEAAIAALQEVAAELGHPPSAAHTKTEKRLPSNPTISKLFGSYGNFIVASGFPRPTRATRYGPPKGRMTITKIPPPAAPEPAAIRSDPEPPAPDRFVSFLYVLLRDELPGGAVERIVQDIEKAGRKRIVYSNKHLAGYANEIGERLLQSTE